ncbi:zinc finger protein 665 [Nematolebias whitei]|uniref:zinc finger protein 665 n=1 Tax=Nematolebias whitei TaxID=451745 RepID=UPI0018986ADE|nr:zinc finger protein 665 [Nematolebias whitei]
MSSVQSLREFISERLTAAAEEIFTEFEKTIVRYEEEIDRQRRLLDISWKPHTHLHTTELQQNYNWKEDEVLAELQIKNQEWNSGFGQEDPKPPAGDQQPQKSEDQEEQRVQIKEEQEEPEPPQLNQEQEESELPQTTGELGEPEPPQMKEEQEELCITRDEEHQVLKLEDETFMVTVDFEERIHREPEPNWDQLPSQNFPHTENQDQEDVGTSGDRELNPKNRPDRSQSSDVKNFSGNLFDPEAEGKPVKCDVCGKRFRDNHQMKEHRRIHTGEKPFTCQTCGKSFSLKSRLTIHRSTHTGEKPYSCKTCGKSFTKRQIVIHMRMGHMRLHTGEKPFLCKICGKCFTRRSGLKIHMKTHTGEKPFLCKSCGKRFSLNCTLKAHLRTHTGEKPFSCETCGNCYSQKSSLIKHIRTHTGEKPFTCEICGKSFSQKIHLISHTRTHTGEKPFCCEICGKSFSQKRTLSDHMETHMGEKPCTSSKPLLEQLVLKQEANTFMVTSAHEERDHIKLEPNWDEVLPEIRDQLGSGPFRDQELNPKSSPDRNQSVLETRCEAQMDRKIAKYDICRKGFSSKYRMDIHRRVHTGEKPYACTTCQKTYKRRDYLLNHMRTHTELPQHFVWRREELEVPTEQQLRNHKMNSGLDQEEPQPPAGDHQPQKTGDQEEPRHLQQEEPEPPEEEPDLPEKEPESQVKEPEPPRMKEEQEELCISQDEEQLGVKLAAETFMVTVGFEEKDHWEPEANWEQLLQNSSETETQDQEGSRTEDPGSSREEELTQNERRPQTREHGDDVDSPELKRHKKSHTACQPRQPSNIQNFEECRANIFQYKSYLVILRCRYGRTNPKDP